ncbi:MAG: hypothetical protein IH991_04105 [Planctomycetes bacterium]|nr:hypothetical protein [Planctomycetota bacterium]
MSRSGSGTSSFHNFDGQDSVALSGDEVARNPATSANESPGGQHSFNLLEVLEEDWIQREIRNPYVGAYHAGRLINAEEWIWLWVSICGDSQHESLPGKVHAKLVEAAHLVGDREACDNARQIFDLIDVGWSAWSNSEACLIAIESLDETFSSLNSSDRWIEAGKIIRLLEGHLDPRAILAMRLGRCVDQSIRRFRADTTQTRLDFLRAKIDLSKPSPDLSWLGEVRGICQQDETFRELLADVPDVTNENAPSNFLETIEKIDRLIRKGLTHIWGDENADYLELQLNTSRQTASRGDVGSVDLGKDFAVIKALCDRGGFVTHEAMERIYRSALDGKGVYPGAFYVKINNLNGRLHSLHVKISAVRGRGWRLIPSK